jgi:flagellar hook protein FlgE
MISALWTGISGLSTSQVALDNESNNIANVNTVGYKASRVSFADQIYQDGIGKGSKIQGAEKQYTQGTMQVTGAEYDMALNGDGFFVVANKSSSGTSENYYTRAGNFRMGENGTLQDANGNEVQGWAISPIDVNDDVISTNSNVTNFTNDYTVLAGNQIVQYSTSIDTYAAKMTDYTQSAKADSEDVFTGAGYKTQSSKITDIEALIVNYNEALDQFATDPDGLSTPSIAQISTIDFPDGAASTLNSEGDQIYVYVNGNKITQNYVETSASTEFIAEINASGVVTDLDGNGTTTTEEYNILASRDSTYKALSDQLSNTQGFVASIVDPNTGLPSTSGGAVSAGVIKIESIIPGQSFTIGDVYEVSSGGLTNPGTSTLNTLAVKGTGEGAVESAMEALKDAVAGKQRDIYTNEDIFSDSDGNAITLATGDTVTFTLNGVPVTVTAGATDTEDDMMTNLATAINTDPTLGVDVKATIVNGELVIESRTTGEEFSGVLTFNDGGTVYTKERNPELSVNSGAGAEFMQIITSVDQTTSQSSLQLRLDTLNISENAFGEFRVDDAGVIYMKQDGVEFAIGQVAIATFNNNIGLDPQGNNLLAKTTTSGEPIFSINNDKTAEVRGENLELSEADLSESLVNLMIFQRAFEANSKSITTADSILNTLIQLKR